MNIPFVIEFNSIAREVYLTAVDKGWYDDGECNKSEQVMLIVTELAEVVEALRLDNPPYDKIPEFTSAEIELADAIIRIMDMAQAYNWRVAEAVVAKMAYNKTRPRKHGGKKF